MRAAAPRRRFGVAGLQKQWRRLGGLRRRRWRRLRRLHYSAHVGFTGKTANSLGQRHSVADWRRTRHGGGGRSGRPRRLRRRRCRYLGSPIGCAGGAAAPRRQRHVAGARWRRARRGDPVDLGSWARKGACRAREKASRCDSQRLQTRSPCAHSAAANAASQRMTPARPPPTTQHPTPSQECRFSLSSAADTTTATPPPTQCIAAPLRGELAEMLVAVERRTARDPRPYLLRPHVLRLERILCYRMRHAVRTVCRRIDGLNGAAVCQAAIKGVAGGVTSSSEVVGGHKKASRARSHIFIPR